MTLQHKRWARASVAAALSASVSVIALAAPPETPAFSWSTVINNNDQMPGAAPGRTFNSYNQPSVNEKGLVVVRARSRGGPPFGPPTHGIYTRDMRRAGTPIVRILDRTSAVPDPNNLSTSFVETPAFPRIDLKSDTIATRGNHQPVWTYVLPDGSETRAGTTGIYANPFGDLITGASKLGLVADFSFFAVPGEAPGTIFEVFPGAPAITNRATIVFKGNFTVGTGKTGVFFRELAKESAGGTRPVRLIASTTGTLIPGSERLFGSTSPPSAANRSVVFAGFDNEDDPTLGGLYLAPLRDQPALRTLVRIGERVPGETSGAEFNRLGEGNAFDGHSVGFWGAWGTATRTVRLDCPTEGNKDRIDYCNKTLVCAGTGERLGDPNSICDASGCYQFRPVPVAQGIFVHDTRGRGTTRTVAKTGARFVDFLFWTYSGKSPCVGSGHSEGDAEDDGEPVRWRASAFVAVSGGATAFKAASGNVIGIYLNTRPGEEPVTVLDTQTPGQAVDPDAPAGSTITEVGIERESLRGAWLAVAASMGVEGTSEEEGMAGIYLTRVPK